MASLALTFKELYDEVSKFLGTAGSAGTPSGTNLTDAKDIVHAAYREFLGTYDWSFLKRYDRIITVSGTWEYELPDDFSHILGTFQFDSNIAYPPLEERSLDFIMDMRNVNSYSSYPEYYAYRPGHYTKELGQKHEVIFYPTIDAAYTLHYVYKLMPEKLSTDSDLHIGGVDVTECLKQFCLAKAESEDEDNLGVQSQKVQSLLQQAINKDKKKQPKNLGLNYMGYGQSAWEIHRGSYRLNDVTFNTEL